MSIPYICFISLEARTFYFWWCFSRMKGYRNVGMMTVDCLELSNDEWEMDSPNRWECWQSLAWGQYLCLSEPRWKQYCLQTIETWHKGKQLKLPEKKLCLASSLFRQSLLVYTDRSGDNVFLKPDTKMKLFSTKTFPTNRVKKCFSHSPLYLTNIFSISQENIFIVVSEWYLNE